MTQKSSIDNLLKAADKALVKFEIVDEKSLVVAEGYASAIAAFGPTVVQSGLKPALAFYCAENKKENRKSDKRKIIDAIACILFSKYRMVSHKKLFNYCLNPDLNINKMERLMIDIVNASIALKMMVRTYKIKESDEK